MATVSVRRGDTMYGIAKRRGIDLARLRAANPKVNPRTLKVGQGFSCLEVATTSTQPQLDRRGPVLRPRGHEMPRAPSLKLWARVLRSACPTPTDESRAAR